MSKTILAIAVWAVVVGLGPGFGGLAVPVLVAAGSSLHSGPRAAGSIARVIDLDHDAPRRPGQLRRPLPRLAIVVATALLAASPAAPARSPAFARTVPNRCAVDTYHVFGTCTS
nr:hypothetical protein GCM10020063_055290 [Dactylosporangium thailandense]